MELKSNVEQLKRKSEKSDTAKSEKDLTEKILKTRKSVLGKQCKRQSKGVDLTFKISVNEEDKHYIDPAESIIAAVTNEAIKTVETSEENTHIRKIIQGILDEIRSESGVRVVEAETGCVIIRLECDTYDQLFKLITYIESKDMKGRLYTLSVSLSCHLQKSFYVSLRFSFTTLRSIMDELDAIQDKKDDDERRIILIGKTGNGKSTTGNSLLGYPGFKAAFSLGAVTRECEVKRDLSEILKIVDTPGLMSAEASVGDVLLEIQNAVKICPRPHAFLLIFKSTDRMTTDERYAVDFLRIALGEKVLDHCIIVFTHGGIFHNAKEFKEFLRSSDIIGKLDKRCEGRITRIENGSSVDTGRNDEVNNLIEMIENLSRNGKHFYEYAYIDLHTKVVLDHLKRYNPHWTLEEELSVLVVTLKNVLPNGVWEAILIGGAVVVAVSALGLAGYGIVIGLSAIASRASAVLFPAILRAIARFKFR